MQPYNDIINYSSERFLRTTGIRQENFSDLSDKVEQYIEQEKQLNPLKRRGRTDSKLSLQDRILIVLYYLRHYSTFQILSSVFGIQESYCQKIYSRYVRVIAEVNKLPNRLELIDNKRELLVIDVSEQPIERPVKHQKKYYSGKKKRHTIKAQLIACVETGEIFSVVCGKGKEHDFSIFKSSHVLIHPDSTVLGDSGYEGLQKYHQNAMTPIKKKKGVERSKEDKAFNKSLSKQRIIIENINRFCKIFRIVKEVYRGKHKNYGLNWHVVAALVNMRYGFI
jgi:hypothetical protein